MNILLVTLLCLGMFSFGFYLQSKRYKQGFRDGIRHIFTILRVPEGSEITTVGFRKIHKE